MTTAGDIRALGGEQRVVTVRVGTLFKKTLMSSGISFEMWLLAFFVDLVKNEDITV